MPESIKTDQKRYRQILFNLLGNSIKFTFKGSITLSIRFSDGCLVSEVTDTGIGMTEEDQTKLFKFFGKLKKSSNINKGGMGLGLTISKMIL